VRFEDRDATALTACPPLPGPALGAPRPRPPKLQAPGSHDAGLLLLLLFLCFGFGLLGCWFSLFTRALLLREGEHSPFSLALALCSAAGCFPLQKLRSPLSTPRLPCALPPALSRRLAPLSVPRCLLRARCCGSCFVLRSCSMQRQRHAKHRGIATSLSLRYHTGSTIGDSLMKEARVEWIDEPR
jgi:hypothetical protein